jgi:hypothetical protein
MANRASAGARKQPDQIVLPHLLTADDVASWLGTTRRAVYARLDRGQFRTAAIRVGRRLYFRSDVLLASLSQQGRVP